MVLPFITPEWPGIGGEIKASPQDFVVEEIPLYDPSGQGDHVYVRLAREGRTTRDVVRDLARVFALKDGDIGTAGQKDKHARSIQTFSLPLPRTPEGPIADRIQAELGLEVLAVRRHGNKLKTGHLLGNRFRVVLSGPVDGALDKAARVSEALQTRGLPNYYGPQRFGADGDNAEKGKEILAGRGPRQKWLRTFLLSAFQSDLFNRYTARRIDQGGFNRIFSGDVAKKTDTGGLFMVEDIDAEAVRFDKGAITYTGPIFGYKMMAAQGEPGHWEADLMAEAGLTPALLRSAGLEGTRRPVRLGLPPIQILPHERGLVFDFSLPKGSYATVLMREFTKTELTAPGEEG